MKIEKQKAESPERSRRVAIFDVDGTIFRSSLLIEVVRVLIENKVFLQKARFGYEKSYQDWLDRKGSYDAYIMDVVRTFEENLPGLSHDDFIRAVKQVIAFHKNRTYVYTRDLIADLKKKGYFMLAISHSPKELLDEFCAQWGFDKVYGRIYEVVASSATRRRGGAIDGTFTGGTLYQEEISDKAKILKRFIEGEGLSLEDSYGVGDSESDIKFLTFVDNPVCFNPNQKLYEHAKKHGWKVVVERKDVVYAIN